MNSLKHMVFVLLVSAVAAIAADEITASFGLNTQKGYLSINITQSSAIDMTGDSFDHRTTTVGTNTGAITISADIGTPGVALFKNNSTNNTVWLGVTGGPALAALRGGESWMGRLATNAISCYTALVIVPASTNISGSVTNIVGASTNVTAELESIVLED